MNSRKIVYLLVIYLCVCSQVSALDRRSYQHGVRLIKDINSDIWAIWSSSPGNPPEGRKRLILADGTRCSYFTHNIYYSRINPGDPQINPKLLIEMPEAQEPVDAAVSSDGALAITFEDGSETDITSCNGIIKQRYKVYRPFPESLTELQTVKTDGAHSGHISAVGDKFVLFYAEGWIDDGGAFDAGTANDVYVETIDSQGEYLWRLPVAKDAGWHRDWWPRVASSSERALLVWQRLVKDSDMASLMIATYDPSGNSIVKTVTTLKENLQYYHYDVQYLENIKRFLIVGNYLGTTILKPELSVVSPKLFVYLLDENGEVVAYWETDEQCTDCGIYPNINLVREARPAIFKNGNIVNVMYPVKPDGIISLTVRAANISLNGVIRQDHYWFPLGADGMFINENEAFFINLTPTGVKTIKVRRSM